MKIRNLSLACLALSWVTSPAHAADPFLLTYYGTVGTVGNDSGAFGLPAGGLSGQEFKVVYTIDPAILTHNLQANFNVYNGDGLIGAVTINNISYTFYSGAVEETDNYSSIGDALMGTAMGNNFGHPSSVYTEISSLVDQFTNTIGFKNIDYSVQAGDVLSGRVYITTGPDIADVTNADLLLNRVTIEVLPEPATWGMMLIGFGAVGRSMRKHRASFRSTMFRG